MYTKKFSCLPQKDGRFIEPPIFFLAIPCPTAWFRLKGSIHLNFSMIMIDKRNPGGGTGKVEDMRSTKQYPGSSL
jgi:hypothetical protein